jgi:hypothetical protein
MLYHYQRIDVLFDVQMIDSNFFSASVNVRYDLHTQPLGLYN